MPRNIYENKRFTRNFIEVARALSSEICQEPTFGIV